MTLIVFLLFYSKDRSNKLTKYLLQCYCVCVSLSLVVGGHDEIIFDILFQTKCKEVVRPRTSQCQWHIGLYNNKDYVVLMMLRKKKRFLKIQRFSGAWSGCYMPWVNDLDGKFNTNCVSFESYPQKGNTMLRMWSNFYLYDHTHKYTLCLP